MTQRELAFYVPPLDPRLPDLLAVLRDHGVRLLGSDGVGRRDPEALARTRSLFEDYGMHMAVIHGEPALVTPRDDLGQLREAHLVVLDRAVAWGAQQVVYHFRSLQLPWCEGVWWGENAYIQEVGLEEYDRRVAEMVAWLCEEAQARGLAIALENLLIPYYFGYQVEEIAAMVERVGAPNLGICLDTGHAHASDLDVAQAVRAAGAHLTTTHLNDNFGCRGPRAMLARVDRHLAPGLGTIDWPEVVRAMDEVGYTGPAVFEGVNTGPKHEDEDWARAVAITVANWSAFERMAAEV